MNTLTTKQIYTIMNNINSQAQGRTTIAPINTGEFVSVGTKLLQTGVENIYGAVSQVLSRSIFSSRVYNSRNLDALRVSANTFGNMTRKISFCEVDLTPNMAFLSPLSTDAAITGWSAENPFKIRKTDVYQTNFYGRSTVADYFTLSEDQLKVAFRDPSEMAQFYYGIVTNEQNKIKQTLERFAASTRNNFIGGVLAGTQAPQVFRAVTAYNAETGNTYTATDIKKPGIFEPFTRWLYGEMKTIMRKMGDRGVRYHQQVNGKTILRHTSINDMRAFVAVKIYNQFESMVNSMTFQPSESPFRNMYQVTYWQNPDDELAIDIVPEGMAADGTSLQLPAVKQDNIICVIMDRDAAGWSLVSNKTSVINNPLAEYSNTHYKLVLKAWNDFTENAVVILLE